MRRPFEFMFSGVPGDPKFATIDLDEVVSFNECVTGDGFNYPRTRVKLCKYEHPNDGYGYILDVDYKTFKSIIDGTSKDKR